jgi:hypothetical protein
MKIRIGSRVKFLNEKGGGIIIGFRDEKIALVETVDGFEVPVQINEIIPEVEASYEINERVSANNDKGLKPEKKKKAPVITFEEKKYVPKKGDLILALVPENEQILHVSNFGLYLINDSNYHCVYVLGHGEKSQCTHIRSGAIEPDSKKLIHKYGQSEISKIKEFQLQGLFYKYGLSDFSAPVDLSFNIEEVSFYKISFFKENDYFKEKALLLKKADTDLQEAVNKLTNSDFAKIIRVKEPDEKKLVSKPQTNQTIKEVDLHIEEIMDNFSALSNGEILEIQLARFETALNTAILSKELKIVFIHGVGNGKLKTELRTWLDKKYPQLKYQDASFKEYGYGATMVYLK